MGNKGAYEFPAWCQMQNALDSYEQARTEHLKAEARKVGPEGERQLGRFNAGADSLIKGVGELGGLDPFDCLAELRTGHGFKTGTPFELLDEHVCVTFAWEAMDMLDTARERFWELLMLLQNRSPCQRARAFLQRVARCYLFGFDAECVVMCRAVLDREFGHKVVDDDQVSDWWEWYKTTAEGKKYKGKKPPYGKLWAKIAAARYAGLVDEAASDAADAVRNRGNDAVHKKPDEGDALDAVRKTVQVLDALGR